MDIFPLGATVTLTATFTDAAGAITAPSAATARVSYRDAAGRRQVASMNLSQSGDEWSADWDSSVAAEGVIDVHARTAAPAPLSAINYQFQLQANRATG